MIVSAGAQRGFSVVELMVAMALSLILMAGVMSIFFSSKVTFFANENTARLQENGRIALDLMVHDLRSAGYSGCSKQPAISTLNNANTLLWNYAQPVYGFESMGGGAYSPALAGTVLDPAPIEDSDVVLIRMLVRDGQALTLQTDLSMPNADPQVPVSTAAPVTPGQIMLISDCNANSIFQVTGWSPGSTNGEIQHAANASGIVPGNATDHLGYLYQAGARVFPLETVIYWVGEEGTGVGPALYRKRGNNPPEMLIEGIQALQIAYGRDTNADRLVDSYTAANGVGNWDNVISVSVALLARSESSGAERDSGTYALLTPAVSGKTLGPFGDNRQRMVFATTVTIRNRAL